MNRFGASRVQATTRLIGVVTFTPVKETTNNKWVLLGCPEPFFSFPAKSNSKFIAYPPASVGFLFGCPKPFLPFPSKHQRFSWDVLSQLTHWNSTPLLGSSNPSFAPVPFYFHPAPGSRVSWAASCQRSWPFSAKL